MEKFVNRTTDGNEKAIRRGVRVPDGDVNLAWVKAPALNPADNLIIVDTSNITPENVQADTHQCKLMYANEMGILGDDFGNEVIFEEYPNVADVFSIDEDFKLTPGNEYTSESILPFVHISRFFHIDFNGYATYETTTKLKLPNVKVVDNNGREYLDDKGKPRYRIALARARDDDDPAQAAYRVYAYVDTDQNENLFLKYNKVELTTEGKFKNQDINHTEILNPEAYFAYIPEETDVFDPANRKKKIYSTKPTNQKEQILGIKSDLADGYRVYVPRKAVTDPRLFQLFRWRVTCDFVEKIKVDPAKTKQVVNCGMVSTNWVNGLWSTGSRPIAPYVLYNMSLSDYNAGELQFVNPVVERKQKTDTTSTIHKNEAKYWNVNFDTISYTELREYDLLVWWPEANTFDFTPYLGKIDYFTRQCGGTLIINCGGRVEPKGLDIKLTATVDPVSGNITTASPYVSWDSANPRYVYMDTLTAVNKQDIFFDADNKLGGWDFNDGSDDEYNSLHPALTKVMAIWTAGRGKMDYINEYPTGWNVILEAKDNRDGVYKPKMIRKSFEGGGAIIFDTCDIGINALADPISGELVSYNLGDTAYKSDDPEWYHDSVSVWSNEGSYKLFYNMVLYALRGRKVDDSDEFTLTSQFSFSSPWHSSWVINNQTADGKNDVLSQSEIDRNQFIERTKSRRDPTVVWQRRLEVPSENNLMTPKTLKQLIDESMSPEDLLKVANSERTYKIEATNSSVLHVDSEDLDENEPPYVWTSEFTPKFNVPPEIGPFIVRERATAGQYVNGQYIARTYPPKPYGIRADGNFTETAQEMDTTTVNWTVHGTATETISIVDKRTENWAANGSGSYWVSGLPFDNGVTYPFGIDSWAHSNYYDSHSNHSYPSYAVFGRFKYGDYNRLVYWIQNAINFFVFWEFLPGPTIATDGHFGTETLDAIYRLQFWYGALEQNGIVDAETLSIIGNLILRTQYAYHAFYGTYIQDWEYPPGIPNYGDPSSPIRTIFDQPLYQMQRVGMSDGNPNFTFSKRTNIVGSPWYTWDVLQVTLGRKTNITGVTVVPHVEAGNGILGGTMLFEALDVLNSAAIPGIDLDNPAQPGPVWNGFIGSAVHNYPANSMPIPVNATVQHGVPYYVPVGPYYGDTVMVRIGQNRRMGIGEILQYGVSDILIHTDQSFFTQKTINITYHGTTTVHTGKDQLIHLKPEYEGIGILTNIQWNSVTTDPDVSEKIFMHIAGDQLLLRDVQVNNTFTENHTSGPYLGSEMNQAILHVYNPDGDPTFLHPLFYSKDEHGRISPVRETGWITKVDGLKLFCDIHGKPYGFPTMPTNIGPNEQERHYSTISLSILDTDPEVMVGFYDIKKQEFILSQEGLPEMTYIEWVSRGPENVFIAAVTDFEVDKKVTIPTDAGPPLPYRLALPVYGICSHPGSHIGVDPLPENLGPFDNWSLPIRTGTFIRNIALPAVFDKPITNEWLRFYAGTTVKAFYGVPEAELGGWSVIHGRPFYDVTDETPIILSDNQIQVRQPPIHMITEPNVLSISGTAADPVRPVFAVYTRTSPIGSWTALKWDDIADYNVSNGVIELREPLISADPAYVKVDYTTARTTYSLKQSDGRALDLNPYPGYNRDLVGKPIYVYVLPQLVKDQDNLIIQGSVRERTVLWTLDPSIFDPTSANYDPLAVQIAVVFVSSSSDIRDLAILDSRRRGGGVKDKIPKGLVADLVDESVNYWDLSHGTGMTYQKGGFVLIRLPRALQDVFPNVNDVYDTIRRNITAGVQFKIEDLEGREW